MQFKQITAVAAVASTVAASQTTATASESGYRPGDVWSTLTPSGSELGATDFTSSFGIAVQTIQSLAKRNVISQIADGQIQAPTNSASDAYTSTIKQTITRKVTASFDFNGAKPTATGDASKVTSTLSPASSMTLNFNMTNGTNTTANDVMLTDASCKNNGTLSLTLKSGILTDSKGRIGAIVSNRQFQFDGPPPQAGSIYAAGWSITSDGLLALGDSDVFYQCLSGSFYNLYDKKVADQCSPIHLEVVSLIDC